MAHGLLYGASFTNDVLSFTDKQGRTICSAYLRDYLTLKATKGNSSVKLIKNGTLSNTYEVNTGYGWTAYEFGTVIPLNNGESCKWRCSAHPTMQSSSNYVQFAMTGKIEASGNVNSMLNRDFENITSLSGYDYTFIHMLSECRSLTKAPSLPATTLAKECYRYMFYRCTSLTKAPSLPATTLDNYCYSLMFHGCTSLAEAPALPATTLADGCYSTMFNSCTSLKQAPSLPATTLTSYCYYDMFRGCSALNEVRISATTTAVSALNNWLYHVADSGTVYADPSFTDLPTDSASGIPQNWTRLPLSDYPTT